jgi:hypothetical protein
VWPGTDVMIFLKIFSPKIVENRRKLWYITTVPDWQVFRLLGNIFRSKFSKNPSYCPGGVVYVCKLSLQTRILELLVVR